MHSLNPYLVGPDLAGPTSMPVRAGSLPLPSLEGSGGPTHRHSTLALVRPTERITGILSSSSVADSRDW
jgi:hypothetical protein